MRSTTTPTSVAAQTATIRPAESSLRPTSSKSQLGLEPDQQEDGVLQHERDRAPVGPLRDPRLGGLQDRRLVAQQQARDDDRDHPGGVDLLGRQVGRERHDERDAGVELRVGDPLAHPGDQREDDDADEDAAGGGPHEVETDLPDTRAPPSRSTITAVAVRRATRAVASLRSDSPSRIVTTRRGSPIRRPIAVAATASGGATTAPIANDAAHEMPGQELVHEGADADGGEGHQPDRQQQDRSPVGVEVDQRALDRGRVQQRRQHAEQHDLGLEVDLGDAGEERRHDADRDQHQRCGQVQPLGQRGEGQDCDGHGHEQQSAISTRPSSPTRGWAVCRTGGRAVRLPGLGYPGWATQTIGSPQPRSSTPCRPNASTTSVRRWAANVSTCAIIPP